MSPSHAASSSNKSRGRPRPPPGVDLQNSLNQGFYARNCINAIHQEKAHDRIHRDQDRDRDLHGPYYDCFYDECQERLRASPVPDNETGIRAFTRHLHEVAWPSNFKLAPVDKYDDNTNPAEWLQVYELSVSAISGDSTMMANYLPVALAPTARTWLLSLPADSIHTWGELCQQFISNF